MSVLDFARFCGELYAEITGNAYQVESPKPNAEELSLRPFRYLSSKSVPQEKLELGSFVRTMILSLGKI
jgi:hypothetical protein